MDPALIAPITEIVEARGPDADRFLDDLARAWEEAELGAVLPAGAAEAAGALGTQLLRMTQLGGHPGCPLEFLQGAKGAIVLAWAEAVAARRDVVLAPLLALALRQLQPPSRLIRAARARVRVGGWIDALSCLPLAGDEGWLSDRDDPDARRARARVELLLRQAGSAALSIPALGGWLWGRREVFALLTGAAPAGARRGAAESRPGTMWQRIVAASAISTAADGLPAAMDPELAAVTAELVRKLACDPEPEVWIPAARSLGRLAPRLPALKTLLFQWLHSEHPSERRRATCALGVMPGLDSWWLESRLERLTVEREDRWALAALGPAIPYLALERRTIWDRLREYLHSPDCEAEVLWSGVHGLLALSRRGALDRQSELLLGSARARALSRPPRGDAEAQLYAEIRRATDFLDGIDPDPQDLDRQLERAGAAALEAGAEAVAPRVTALGRSIGPTWEAAAARAGRGDDDAVALILESSARALAIGSWRAILDLTRGGSDALAGELAPVAEAIERSAVDLWRREDLGFGLRRGALRALSYAIEASPEPGPAAARVLAGVESAAWLGAGRDLGRYQKSLADLFSRISGAAAATDPADQGRLTAWWALAAARADLAPLLGRRVGALRGLRAEGVANAAATLRSALDPASAAARDGAQGAAISGALEDLDATPTALGRALAGLSTALEQAARARAVDAPAARAVAVIALAEAAAELAPLIADPGRALAAPVPQAWPEDRYRDLAAATVEELRAGRLTGGRTAQWSDGLGPVVGPLLAGALGALARAMAATTVDPAPPRAAIGPYRLDRRLGAGAQGEVWRVEHQRTGRYFVMKLLPPRLWEGRSQEQREQLRGAIELDPKQASGES